MKPTAFIRSSMEMLASKDRRWLALFSLAIGVALAWTYTPLFLTPLGTGMGAALFSADGSVVAFFVATALTYLADAAFGTKPRAKAALRKSFQKRFHIPILLFSSARHLRETYSRCPP